MYNSAENRSHVVLRGSKCENLIRIRDPGAWGYVNGHRVVWELAHSMHVIWRFYSYLLFRRAAARVEVGSDARTTCLDLRPM